MVTRAQTLKGIASDLERRSAELRQRIAEIEVEQQAPLDPDASEQAIEREDDQALEGVEAALVAELQATEAALERIAAGTYGVCSSCGEPIGAARLQALPTATRCIGCEGART